MEGNKIFDLLEKIYVEVQETKKDIRRASDRKTGRSTE